MRGLRNIYNLGVKELRSLLGDKAMLALIVFAFTISVYSSATVLPGSLHLAPIAIADMDQSQLSNRIVNSFYRPWFLPPEMITATEMDAGLDAGRYTFAVNIPPNFQRDVLAGRQPDIQVNVDATRMSQAFTGNSYIQNIISGEVNSFVARARGDNVQPVSLEIRMRFNPNLDPAWFGGVMAIINNITMLAIVLTGSALIREREHGTVEHLLVMPVTPFEIMMAKVWSMGLVVLVVSGLSLMLMVKGVLGAEPVRHHFNWDFYGHHRPFDAAAGVINDSGAVAATNALRRFHAARKYAAGGAGYYADHADDAFCQPCPGYSLSRRRFEYRLAAVPDPAGDRRRVLPDSAVTLQKNDWHNGVNIIAGWRLRLIRPTNDRRANVGRASEAPPALVFFRQTLQVAVAHAALGDNIIGKMLYVAHIALQNGDLQTVIVVDMDVQRGDG